ALPFPYELSTDAPVTQSIAVKFAIEQDRPRHPDAANVTTSGTTKTDGADRPRPVAIRLDDGEWGTMPAIGIAVRPEELDAAARASAAIDELKASFLLCHLDLSRGHGAQALHGYAGLSRETGTPIALEIALACTALPV